MRWYRFGTDFFACDCEKLKMYWMYIEFFGKKQAGKDVPKMCRRINQRFLSDIFVIILPGAPALLIPKATEMPSRGSLSPLFGGKGSVLWGIAEL